MTAKLIVILGMHRSGTSTITRSLEAFGTSLGKNLLEAVPGNNEKGFFEDKDILELNDSILAKFGCSWNSPYNLDDLDLSSGLLFLERAKAEKLLREKMSSHSIYAIKDPRISILLPFWKKVFSQAGITPYYIISLRHPTSVAKSLEARDNISKRDAVRLWTFYNNKALANTNTEKRLIVEYDNIIDDTLTEINKIADFIQLAPLQADNSQLENFSETFLSADLRHHKTHQADEANDVLHQALYSAMQTEAQSRSKSDTQETIEKLHALSPHTELLMSNNIREATIDVDYSHFDSLVPTNDFILKIEKLVRHARFIIPSRHTKKSLRKLHIYKASSIEGAKELIRDHKKISLDFFDTIVQRKIDPPEKLKEKTAEFAALKLLEASIYITPNRFLSVRNHLEKTLRDESVFIKGLDHETCIRQIFEHTLATIGHPAPQELAGTLIEFEVNTELCALQLQPGIKEFLQACKANSIKIIVTSDMYLRATEIKKIMTHLGIADYFDSVIVSSDFGRAKYSGKLFSESKSALKAENEKILHIGDNILSDVHSAHTNGMAAAWLYEQENLVRRLRLQSKDAESELRAIAPPQDASETFKLGCKKIAPSVTFFCYRTLFDAHKLGLKKLLFISREGVFLKQVCELLQKEVQLFKSLETIDLETLYASRTSTVACTYMGFKSARALKIVIEKTIYRQQHFSIGNFLKVFGVPSEVASTADWEPLWGESAIARLTAFLQSPEGQKAHQFLEQAKAITRDYFAQFGIENEPFGLVDVGWAGTIQDHIAHMIKSNGWKTKAYGFYLGSNSLRSSAYTNDLYSRIFPGYIANETDRDIRTTTMVKAMPLLEICFTDPTLETTVGYTRKNDTITPLFESKNDGSERIYREILASSLYHAEKFAEISNLYTIDPTKTRNRSRNALLDLMTNPTKNEAKLFEKTEFDFGWGELGTHKLTTPVAATDLISPTKLTIKLMSAGWWQGSLAASGLGFCIFLINWYVYLRSKNIRIITKLKTILKLTR